MPTLTSGSELGATTALCLKISRPTVWTLLAYLVPPRDLEKRDNSGISPILSGWCSALQPQHADEWCSCNFGQLFIPPAQGRGFLSSCTPAGGANARSLHRFRWWWAKTRKDEIHRRLSKIEAQCQTQDVPACTWEAGRPSRWSPAASWLLLSILPG